MYEIRRTPEFDEWMDTLDSTIADRVIQTLRSMSRGNWGDYKPLSGVSGIFERRFTGRGPGIRLYFCRRGRNMVLMLTGGDKSTQERRDIARAQSIRDQYR